MALKSTLWIIQHCIHTRWNGEYLWITHKLSPDLREVPGWTSLHQLPTDSLKNCLKPSSTLSSISHVGSFFYYIENGIHVTALLQPQVHSFNKFSLTQASKLRIITDYCLSSPLHINPVTRSCPWKKLCSNIISSLVLSLVPLVEINPSTSVLP